MELFNGILSINGTAFLIFSVILVAAIGYILGRITIKGVSLGTAGVFLIALVYGGVFYDDVTTQMFIMLAVWCLEHLNDPPREVLVNRQQHAGFACKYIKS